ncbi:MAG: glycosyltransferase [Phycisphaerales bacterium]
MIEPTATTQSGRAPIAVLLAGGGSGGHIFPAVAIAERLREREPGLLCRYLVSDRPLDAAILQSLDEPFAPLPARPPSVRPRALVRFLMTWGGAVRAARETVRAAKREADAVVMVATGGFVSAPAAQAARAEGVPVVLVNLDSAPGKASRFVGRFARIRCTPEGSAPASWQRIRPVVRDAARASGTPAACRERLGLDLTRRTLLVTGASQGANSINRLLEALVGAQGDAFDGWQVVHQTGANEDARVRAAYEAAGVLARVEAFFDGMGDAWGAADLAVSRAGAGSVGEAWANRVPTLFLPYPFHRDEHQRRNAEPLERAGAAVIERDRVSPDANLAGAGDRLVSLLADEARRAEMRSAFDALGPADGGATVADLVLGVVRTAGDA